MKTDLERMEFDLARKIDPRQLDVECVRQADVFYTWAERAVLARAEVDRLDAASEVQEARLQANVRSNPGDYGIENVTEAAVKAAVRKDKKLIRAQEALAEAKLTAALLDKAVIALDMKKRMLEGLITLHGQSYFAGPDVPRNLSKKYHDHLANTSQAVDRQRAALEKRRGTKSEGSEKRKRTK